MINGSNYSTKTFILKLKCLLIKFANGLPKLVHYSSYSSQKTTLNSASKMFCPNFEKLVSIRRCFSKKVTDEKISLFFFCILKNCSYVVLERKRKILQTLSVETSSLLLMHGPQQAQFEGKKRKQTEGCVPVTTDISWRRLSVVKHSQFRTLLLFRQS